MQNRSRTELQPWLHAEPVPKTHLPIRLLGWQFYERVILPRLHAESRHKASATHQLTDTTSVPFRTEAQSLCHTCNSLNTLLPHVNSLILPQFPLELRHKASATSAPYDFLKFYSFCPRATTSVSLDPVSKVNLVSVLCLTEAYRLQFKHRFPG